MSVCGRPTTDTLEQRIFSFLLLGLDCCHSPARIWICAGVNHLGGFGTAGMHVHIMHMLGLVMIVLFVLLYFAPYRQFRDGVAAKDWALAARHLNNIRRIVGINTILGLITVIVGASGRLWS